MLKEYDPPVPVTSGCPECNASIEELVFEEERNIVDGTSFKENGEVDDDYWEREHDELLDWCVSCGSCKAVFSCKWGHSATTLLTGLVSTKESRRKEAKVIDYRTTDLPRM